MTRYYLAATKHVEFSGIGTVGVHVAWVIGKAMSDVHYSRPAAGVNFHFGMKGEGFWQKALNGFNLMGGAYGERKRRDFFIRHLQGLQTPDWNKEEKK